MRRSLDPEIVRSIEAFLGVQGTGKLELSCKDGEVVELRVVAARLWRTSKAQLNEPLRENGRNG